MNCGQKRTDFNMDMKNNLRSQKRSKLTKIASKIKITPSKVNKSNYRMISLLINKNLSLLHTSFQTHIITNT
jgi:hypothetical protein